MDDDPDLVHRRVKKNNKGLLMALYREKMRLAEAHSSEQVENDLSGKDKEHITVMLMALVTFPAFWINVLN